MNHVLVIRTFCMFFYKRSEQLVVENLYECIKNLIYNKKSLSSVQRKQMQS